MKKLLLSLTLAFVMAFSCATVGFASVPDEVSVEPRATSMIGTAVSRDSGTDASATIDVDFAGTMDSYTVTVYLQKLSNNNWVNDSSNEDYVKRSSGTNRDYSIFDCFYDDLTRGTSYRLKVVSKTVLNGVSYQRTGYSHVF
ncbi:MAG: hypothetical protein IKT62_00785 [Firmicutes bacterium]|nr:hypothetical protein [Bacillota bacterium]